MDPQSGVIAEILQNACASIRYRMRRELLAEDPTDPLMLDLQQQILRQPAVQAIQTIQAADGWIGVNFHGMEGTESGIRHLLEMGVEPEQPVLARALDAVRSHPEKWSQGIGKAGIQLDAAGLGGTHSIAAALLCQAGLEQEAPVADEFQHALTAFEAVLNIPTLHDLLGEWKGKQVLLPGRTWPSIYQLRLLAYAQSWRTPERMSMLAAAVEHMAHLSPLPSFSYKWKYRLISPASFCMHDFNPDVNRLTPAGWMMWFHRMELLTRLGIIPQTPVLQNQVEGMRSIRAGGWFPLALEHSYFRHWGAYPGLMLENDWKDADRRRYDLTFRCLLIEHGWT